MFRPVSIAGALSALLALPALAADGAASKPLKPLDPADLAQAPAILALPEGVTKEQVLAADTDDDGFLSEDELRAAREAGLIPA